MQHDQGRTFDSRPHKGYKKYPTPVGCMWLLLRQTCFHQTPDPDPVESAPPEPDHIEGLSLRMTQAMNHYQRQEHRCFVCGDSGHFARECPHCEAFRAWHKDHLNSLGWARKTGHLPQRPKPQTNHQGCFLPKSSLDCGNRAHNEVGRTRDTSGHGARMVQSLGTG